MNNGCSLNAWTDGSQHVVCHCMQVTEAQVVTALTVLDLRSVKDIRQCTGAGDGCTACHKALRKYLEQHACRPAPADLAAAG
jgi:bacterioferritin-associated ferredoxin